MHISVNWVETTALVELSGEVDMSTVPLMHEYLEELLPRLRAGLVLDLTLVTFLDSSGLAFLCAADRRVKAHGGRLVVYAPTRRIRRLFEISGLTPILEIVPTEPAEIKSTQ